MKIRAILSFLLIIISIGLLSFSIPKNIKKKVKKEIKKTFSIEDFTLSKVILLDSVSRQLNGIIKRDLENKGTHYCLTFEKS